MGLQTALHYASASPASPSYSCFLKQLGAQSHIPVQGEPFPPLRPAGLCLLHPKALAFVLGSKGPLWLRARSADI